MFSQSQMLAGREFQVDGEPSTTVVPPPVL